MFADWKCKNFITQRWFFLFLGNKNTQSDKCAKSYVYFQITRFLCIFTQKKLYEMKLGRNWGLNSSEQSKTWSYQFLKTWRGHECLFLKTQFPHHIPATENTESILSLSKNRIEWRLGAIIIVIQKVVCHQERNMKAAKNSFHGNNKTIMISVMIRTIVSRYCACCQHQTKEKPWNKWLSINQSKHNKILLLQHLFYHFKCWWHRG